MVIINREKNHRRSNLTKIKIDKTINRRLGPTSRLYYNTCWIYFQCAYSLLSTLAFIWACKIQSDFSTWFLLFFILQFFEFSYGDIWLLFSTSFFNNLTTAIPTDKCFYFFVSFLCVFFYCIFVWFWLVLIEKNRTNFRKMKLNSDSFNGNIHSRTQA